MAKNKDKGLKETTVERINKIIKKYDLKTSDDLKAHEKYVSLKANYMNGEEKDYEDLIISLCFKGLSYDEIKLAIESEKTTDEKIDTLFMISSQKVVEVADVEVIVEGETPADEPASVDETQTEAPVTEAPDVEVTQLSSLEEIMKDVKEELSNLDKDDKEQLKIIMNAVTSMLSGSSSAEPEPEVDLIEEAKALEEAEACKKWDEEQAALKEAEACKEDSKKPTETESNLIEEAKALEEAEACKEDAKKPVEAESVKESTADGKTEEKSTKQKSPRCGFFSDIEKSWHHTLLGALLDLHVAR